MKKIINHLKENWIRHGFETLVVAVGILVAFTLNNWNEGRKTTLEDKRYSNSSMMIFKIQKLTQRI